MNRSVNLDRATVWVLDSLSVLVANILVDQASNRAFADFAYDYFEQSLPRPKSRKDLADEYGAALYVAVHQALLKSDAAAVRSGLLVRYGVEVDRLDQFIEFNRRIDALLRNDATARLARTVDRQGAPLRIIRQMIDNQNDLPHLLTKRESFLDEFERQVSQQYSTVMTRINRALVRSVIFLIITKFLIGVAIEVPYDLWVHGKIEWLPLGINLLFPPIYMVLLRLTLNAPGYANTEALVKRVDVILYGEDTTIMRRQLSGRR